MSPEKPNSEENDPEPAWSEEEKRFLQHAILLGEVVRMQAQTPNDPKPWWLRILESGGGAAIGAAIVTALLGGIVVQFVSGSIQGHQKEREFQQAWMQARGSQALTAYKEDLDQAQKIVSQAYEIIGDAVKSSEDLIDLTGPELALKYYRGKERKKVADQRFQIRKTYNLADAQWRSQKEILSLQISLYHHGNPDISEGWQAAQTALSAYMDCASDWYGAHYKESTNTSDKVCVKQRAALLEGLTRLTTALTNARSAAREDWASPDKLIQKLEKAHAK